MNDLENLQPVKDWLGAGSINIFGRPFAGKDTQGRRLAKLFNAPLLGGGDILRASHMPDFVKELNRTGKLFPTNVYMEMVLPYLSQKDFRGKPLILSAVGRRHGEEAGILEATAAAGHPIKAVVYLDMTEAATWKRWKKAHVVKDRGERDDDSYEALHIRLKEFSKKTTPVINFYRDENLLVELDGDQDPDVLTDDIINALLRHSRIS